MTLGEKIQKLRKSCGLSQLQLAEQLDVSRQSVSKWELNESVPDINKIVRLSELFSVSVDELLKEQYTSYVENVDTKSTIEDIVQMNYINSLIKIGIKTTILGTVLIVLECLFLPVLAIIQKSQVNGQGFYTDFMDYISVQPMPIIYILTIIIICVGIFLVFWGSRRKRKSHNGEGDLYVEVLYRSSHVFPKRADLRSSLESGPGALRGGGGECGVFP